jgi:hypothetical protein
MGLLSNVVDTRKYLERRLLGCEKMATKLKCETGKAGSVGVSVEKATAKQLSRFLRMVRLPEPKPRAVQIRV